MKSRLKKYKVPDGTRKLGDISFRGCGLETVTLPKSLEEIGMWAFSFCDKLTALNLPRKVRTIGYGAFEGSAVCTITVTGGNTVYEVRDGALFDRTRDILHSVLVTPGLKRYEIPEGTKEIAGCAFGQVKSLKEIVIPETVTKIGSWAFRDTGLGSVIVPDSVTELGDRVFSFCPDLKEAALSAGLEEIPYGTFAVCQSLESVTIKPGTKTIGVAVFDYCNTLAHVSIPQGVEKIYENAFYGCENLVSLNIPASVMEISDSAFALCNKLTLNVVKGSYAQKYAESNGIPFKVKAD